MPEVTEMEMKSANQEVCIMRCKSEGVIIPSMRSEFQIDSVQVVCPHDGHHSIHSISIYLPPYADSGVGPLLFTLPSSHHLCPPYLRRWAPFFFSAASWTRGLWSWRCSSSPGGRQPHCPSPVVVCARFAAGREMLDQ